MKILSLTGLAFIVSVGAKAQQVITNVDKFTGDTVSFTENDTLRQYKKFDKKGRLELTVPFLECHATAVNKKGGKSYKFLVFEFTAKKALFVSNANKIFFKAKNDSVFIAPMIGKSKVYAQSEIVRFSINLTKELNDKLSDTDLNAIRIETSEGYEDYSIDADKHMSVSNQVRSISH